MPYRHTRAPRRAFISLAAAGALVVVSALPAVAHVTVSSPDAAPGGFGKLVFRVPTESDTASTTKLQVTLPVDNPFAFVSTRPLPGWTVTTVEHKLDKPVRAEGFTLTKAVSSVTWTAAPGHGIGPGEFEEFELSVGPFPEGVSAVSLPTVQTYSDGAVVGWNQATEAGKPEPEHPAPTLDLAAAAQPAVSAEAAGPKADDSLARWLGGLGLALGAAATAVALWAGRRRQG